jgi:hypothetical protein
VFEFLNLHVTTVAKLIQSESQVFRPKQLDFCREPKERMTNCHCWSMPRGFEGHESGKEPKRYETPRKCQIDLKNPMEGHEEPTASSRMTDQGPGYPSQNLN